MDLTLQSDENTGLPHESMHAYIGISFVCLSHLQILYMNLFTCACTLSIPTHFSFANVTMNLFTRTRTFVFYTFVFNPHLQIFSLNLIMRKEHCYFLYFRIFSHLYLYKCFHESIHA